MVTPQSHDNLGFLRQHYETLFFGPELRQELQAELELSTRYPALRESFVKLNQLRSNLLTAEGGAYGQAGYLLQQKQKGQNLLDACREFLRTIHSFEEARRSMDTLRKEIERLEQSLQCDLPLVQVRENQVQSARHTELLFSARLTCIQASVLNELSLADYLAAGSVKVELKQQKRAPFEKVHVLQNSDGAGAMTAAAANSAAKNNQDRSASPPLHAASAAKAAAAPAYRTRFPVVYTKTSASVVLAASRQVATSAAAAATKPEPTKAEIPPLAQGSVGGLTIQLQALDLNAAPARQVVDLGPSVKNSGVGLSIETASASAGRLAIKKVPKESPEGSSSSSPPTDSPSPSPLPAAGSASASGEIFMFGPAAGKGHRRASISSNLGLFSAVGRAQSHSHWPAFSDIQLLIGLENDKPITAAELEQLRAFRKKLPQRQLLPWDMMTQAMQRLPQKHAKLNSRTLQTASGTKFKFYEYTDPIPVHFSGLGNSNRILDKLVAAVNHPEKLQEPDFILKSMSKMSLSIMRTDETMSYMSSQKYSGIGFGTIIKNPTEGILQTHHTDSWSPTYFEAPPGVTSISQKDTKESVIFYNNFWLRYSAVVSYAYALFQNTEKLLRIHPIRGQLDKIRAELILIKAPQAIINKLAEIVGTPDYTEASIQDALRGVHQVVVEAALAKEVMTATTLTGIIGALPEDAQKKIQTLSAKPTRTTRFLKAIGNVFSSKKEMAAKEAAAAEQNKKIMEQILKAVATAPKEKQASKFSENMFVDVLKRVFNIEQENLSLEAAITHVQNELLRAMRTALMSVGETVATRLSPVTRTMRRDAVRDSITEATATALPNEVAQLIADYGPGDKPQLLRYVDESIRMVEEMSLKPDSSLERWSFAEIFRRPRLPDETILGEFTKMARYLERFCEENLPKLRKADDKEPDSTLFSRMLTPTELVRYTAAGSYNEVNIRTDHAAFNCVVFEDCFLDANGKIPDEFAALFTKAKSANLPLIILKTPKKNEAGK